MPFGLPGPGGLGRVEWFASQAEKLLTTPHAAFRLAAAESAGAAARKINSKASGNLARDLSRPRFLGALHAQIGSNRPYAGIEDHGGTIQAKNQPRMLIHGNRVGSSGRRTRSSFGGPIVASAVEVKHEGKHWSSAALLMYPVRFTFHLRRLMPH